MNEQLRQLEHQCWEVRQYNPPWFNATKFAELIVRECVKVVDDMADPEDSERYFWAIQNASTKIKQHFGVEE